MLKTGRKFLICCSLIVGFLLIQTTIFAQREPNLEKVYENAKNRRGKNPVIIIPGILGSHLKNGETGEDVWFSIARSKDDDLRLPVALDLKSSKDKLVPDDVIREVNLKLLPDIKVYKGLIETLTKYGGYEEASWDDPPENLNDKFFVFPYDWRRDNVETARILIEKIEKLRADSNQPKAKFNLLAHSMGGLIARYAAMYGKADLPQGKPQPTWAGERYFNKIFLFGVPNEGSTGALQTLFEGRSSISGSSGIDLPFVRNLTPTDVATMPALFQLIPHQRTGRYFDEDLKPLKLNIFDIETWKKYKWGIYSDDKYLKEFSEDEGGRFERYFALVLARANKFHQALDAYSSKRLSVGLFIIGSDCKDTLDALVIYRDAKDKKWITLTKPHSFTNSKGVKIADEEIRKVIIVPGDGRVSRYSLLAETLAADRRRSNLFDSALPLTYALFICEGHDDITSNTTIQDNLLTALISEADQ